MTRGGGGSCFAGAAPAKTVDSVRRSKQQLEINPVLERFELFPHRSVLDFLVPVFCFIG
jgi:hypothetical protein